MSTIDADKVLAAAATAEFTESQKDLVKKLCEVGQTHLFENWLSSSGDDGSADDNAKQRLVKQLESLNESYTDGGLIGYITNARKLLKNSKDGVNPLEGWKPSIPQGEMFELGTSEYQSTEALGIAELGNVGFVLVAGGLGERLGYSDIKIGLPTEMTTETCYIQYYIEYILAVQEKYGNGKQLPLCIMTSGDTNAKTIALLSKYNYFGMSKNQITIVQQGEGVPALTDNDASIAYDSVSNCVITKPHGHGDIHELLYRHGVAKKWLTEQGIKWLVMFQDTNGLAFHTLPLMLGVSCKHNNLIQNSMCVPRKAKQAIGGISKLTKTDTGETRTINVEYNQLDPLLRANGYNDGDVNDPNTGYSPFPGNINQLLFRLDAYVDTLERTKGLMPEFVNPKYKDETKTVFKKPTRLECMMQDFPTVLTGEEAQRVGFTSIAADMCFSPVKNATEDGVRLQANGTQPGTAANGEADQLAACRTILRSIGCHVEDAPEETYNGIKVIPGPAIVLKHNFACCPNEYKTKFPNPSQIKISSRSTLVVKGSGVTIERLDLDGALVIDCANGATVTVNREQRIKNEGWVRVKTTTAEDDNDEILKMRGYRIERRGTECIE